MPVAIPVSEARSLFTKTLMDKYRERAQVTSFLRSFFPSKEYATKYVSIEVERSGEKVAVDVNRESEGNRNTFSKSTEKIFEPPYYREYFDITKLDLYDRAFGSSMTDSGLFTQLVEDAADKLGMLQDKIERAYELQASQVLETGVVQLVDGGNIDYKRRSASLVNLTGTPWTTGTVNPYAHLEAAGNFLRQVGKVQGGTIHAIMGSEALAAFLANDIVVKRGPLTNVSLDAIAAPQRFSTGATLHGWVTAGSYRVYIWAYPEFYDNSGNSSTSYVHPKKVIVLPENPRFRMAFGAVPQLLDENNPVPVKAAYVYGEYVDQRKFTKDYDVRSSGLVVPVGIDHMYTMQVVA